MCRQTFPPAAGPGGSGGCRCRGRPQKQPPRVQTAEAQHSISGEGINNSEALPLSSSSRAVPAAGPPQWPRPAPGCPRRAQVPGARGASPQSVRAVCRPRCHGACGRLIQRSCRTGAWPPGRAFKASLILRAWSPRYPVEKKSGKKTNKNKHPALLFQLQGEFIGLWPMVSYLETLEHRC